MFPFVLYQYSSPVFLRDHNGNKVIQLFCAIPAIGPDGELSYNNFQF